MKNMKSFQIFDPRAKRKILTLSMVFLMLSNLVMPLSGSYAFDNDFKIKRGKMIEGDIKGRGITDKKVIHAMSKIERHLFVNKSLMNMAYEDHPLPIGEGQTISQPYVVALMTEALNLKSTDKVLEIGTGSGYQAAVLAEIVSEVYTIEIRKNLAEKTEKLLKVLGYENIKVKYGDGYFGWEEYGPFDAIIVTASANHIPSPLIKQLKEGGRLIIPLGSTLYYQILTMAIKKRGQLDLTQMDAVSFVPMSGEAQKR